MGATPMLGRGLTTQDRASDRALVVSFAFWRDVLRSDRDAVGRAVTIDGERCTIAGVLPRAVELPSGVDVWRLLEFTPRELDHTSTRFYTVYGRLRPGESLAAANVAMRAIAAGLDGEFGRDGVVRGVRLQDALAAPVRDKLLFAQGIALIVLLIGCVNLANLLMARASERQRELRVRAALGAGRARLVRQLLTESVVLALLGGAVGTVLAYWIVPPLAAAYPGELPNLHAIVVNVGALQAAVGLALVASVFFGVVPALLASRAARAAGLKEQTHATASRQARWVRSSLVTLEVALALMLFTGAALLARSFVGLTSQPLGFDPARVLTARVSLPPSEYSPARTRRFYADLFERLRRDPDVVGAAAATGLPFAGATPFLTIGLPPKDGETKRWSFMPRLVSEDYFKTLGVPLVQGRTFEPGDGPDAAGVAVVNESFARRYGGDAIHTVGMRLPITDGGLTIVGVVADTRSRFDWALSGRAELYLPLAQAERAPMNTSAAVLVVRTRSDAGAFGPRLEAAVAALDANLPLQDVAPLTDAMGDSVAARRFNMNLLVAFASVAVLLSTVGVFGMTAFVVALRTREVGVRLALGADPRQVKLLIVRQGIVPVLVGCAAGLVGAWELAGLLKAQLFHLTPHDPWTLAASVIALSAIGVAACWLPARRTARVDPVSVLRAE